MIEQINTLSFKPSPNPFEHNMKSLEIKRDGRMTQKRRKE